MIVFVPMYHGPLKDYGFCHLVDGAERDALSAAFIGLESSDRPAYYRNAPVLRLWSNRLGRPNAEIA